jgi:hypothetical protein
MKQTVIHEPTIIYLIIGPALALFHWNNKFPLVAAKLTPLPTLYCEKKFSPTVSLAIM